MAQFAHQYVSALLLRQSQLASAHPNVIPSDPITADRQTYSMNLTQLLISAVIMRVISQIGGVTDAQWSDAFDHAIDSSPENPWPDWVVNQTMPPS